MHGQAVIKGTRIPVALIVDYIADGYAIQDVLNEFPHLTPEDVQEALHYASSLLKQQDLAVVFLLMRCA